jgi:hypothetical protein
MSNETDDELEANLKAAKTKRMYFALVMKGGADGALVIEKTKVPATAIAAAKKKSGGSAVLTGFVFYENGQYVFEVGRVPPATAANVIKTIAKRDGNQSIHPLVRLGTDPELQEITASATGGTPQPQPGNNGGPQKPFGDAERKFCDNTWAQATAKIRGDLKSLSSRIAAEVDGEADLGPEIEAYVNDKLAHFETSLHLALDHVEAVNDGEREKARQEAVATIDGLQREMQEDKAITTLWEKNPFGAINVSPVLKATFNAIKKTVAV